MLNLTMKELKGTFCEDPGHNDWLWTLVPCTEASSALNEVEAWLNDEEPPDPYDRFEGIRADSEEFQSLSPEEQLEESWEQEEFCNPSDEDEQQESSYIVVLYSGSGVAHAFPSTDFLEYCEVDFSLTPEEMAKRFQEHQKKISKDRKEVRMERRELNPKRPVQKPVYKTRRKHKLSLSLVMTMQFLAAQDPDQVETITSPGPVDDIVMVPGTLYGDLFMPTCVPQNQLKAWATTGDLEKLQALEA